MKLRIILACLSLVSLCGLALAGGTSLSTTAKSGVPTWSSITANSPPNAYNVINKKCSLVAVTRSSNSICGTVQLTQNVFFCGATSSPCKCSSYAWLSVSCFSGKLSLISSCAQKSTFACP